MKKAPVVRIVVLGETNGMSDQALYCRANGHQPVRVPPSLRQVQKDLAEGVVEYLYRCSNGCGYWRRTIRATRTFAVIKQTGGYDDKSYVMPKGTGRLRRDEACAAQFVREWPELAAAV